MSLTMENIDILKAEIKSILAVKAKEGATFRDIKDEYAGLIGKELCFDSAKKFNSFMETVSDVRSLSGYDGHLHWYTKSEKSKHIASMVKKQRPPRDPRPMKKKLFYNSTSTCFYNSTSTCFYNDNYIYKSRRQSKSDSILNDSKGGGKSALFYNYELIGDDFFLNVAHLDCKHKIEHIETIGGYKGRRIRKCGKCISGQCIKDVTKMLQKNVQFSHNIILNIGSVDLLHGHDLIDMKNDFMALYMELEKRGIEPVVTTLAPLANISFSQDYQMKWQGFNAFLMKQFPNVVDITSCFLTNTQRVLFDCYQPSPVYVSGSNQAHSLWNYVGRHRVVKYLKKSLAEIIYRNVVCSK